MGLYNDVIQKTGSFSVSKKVEGSNKETFSKETFRIDYTCENDSKGTLDVKGDGTSVDGPLVPVGTKCVVTEKEKLADSGAEREATRSTPRSTTEPSRSRRALPVPPLSR